MIESLQLKKSRRYALKREDLIFKKMMPSKAKTALLDPYSI